MNRTKPRVWLACWLSGFAFLLALPPRIVHAGEDRVIVHPADTGAALVNPGMGWVLHFYDNTLNNYGRNLDPGDPLDDWPGLTTVYFRLAWAHLEPREGEFNWPIVDTPAQRWIARGKKIAFRFTCCESNLRYATPEWVQAVGAKGHNFKPEGGLDEHGALWEPDYDDPVFLAKLDHFLAAAAARYDGDPHVAFIDVGSFGIWGEGHTFLSTKLSYSAATVKRHIDLHLAHFKRTQLVANDDFVEHGRGQSSIDYANEKGLTLRDDSILVGAGEHAYYHSQMAQPFWPQAPVIIESAHYGFAKKSGTWGDGSKYLQALEDYHASYASIHFWPREFLKANTELVARMNLRLGYRLQLVEASWPAQIERGKPFRFISRWRNAGAAPCLPGGHPALTLKNEKGAIVSAMVDEHLDARSLPAAAPGKAEPRASEANFTLPQSVAAGTYEAWISVGSRIGTPTIALPLPDSDGALRYRLGKVIVRGE